MKCSPEDVLQRDLSSYIASLGIKFHQHDCSDIHPSFSCCFHLPGFRYHLCLLSAGILQCDWLYSQSSGRLLIEEGFFLNVHMLVHVFNLQYVEMFTESVCDFWMSHIRNASLFPIFGLIYKYNRQNINKQTHSLITRSDYCWKELFQLVELLPEGRRD